MFSAWAGLGLLAPGYHTTRAFGTRTPSGSPLHVFTMVQRCPPTHVLTLTHFPRGLGRILSVPYTSPTLLVLCNGKLQRFTG
ncbi:hypothetical protein V1507DRAFT_84256 [Lipomyces tetrasporus]